MANKELERIEVSFSLSGSERTHLLVTRGANRGFEARSAYARKGEAGFPTRETAEGYGRVDDVLAEALARQIMLVCKEGWYHRYPSRLLAFGGLDRFKWEIVIELSGLPVRRWEGFDAIPPGMRAVVDALVTFGMYPLREFAALARAEERLSQGKETLTHEQDDGFGHILCYERLFDEVLGAMDDPGEQGLLLVDEFCDDMRIYLEQHLSEKSRRKRGARLPWSEGLSKLCTADVGNATREDMLERFNLLMKLGDPQATITEFVSNGTFARWCERLRDIPEEERMEQQREREQARINRVRRVDDAIRRRMKGETPFTSYDVAGDCDVTAQQASVRIRAFVRNGDLLPLEGELPRRYRAAA